MPREKVTQPTRQLYAQISEDVYLAAKARAAEMRVPLRVLLENALVNELSLGTQSPTRSSVWDDEYLSMQERQPIGSPIELSRDEAGAILGEASAVHSSTHVRPVSAENT